MLNIAQNILSYRQKILLMIGKIDRNKCSIFIGAGRDKKKKKNFFRNYEYNYAFKRIHGLIINYKKDARFNLFYRKT